MAKTAKKKPFKATAATKRRSRGDLVKQIALGTELKPGKVKEVFDALTQIMVADLGKKGIYYRLRLGGFDSQDDAKSACGRLKSRGVSCFVSRADS